MADSWFACKGCSGSDRTQDTVKVDPKVLSQGHRNKENVGPLQLNAAEKDAISKKHEAEERMRAELAKKAERRKAEEAAKAVAAEEERLHQEAQKAAAEEAQRQEDERLRLEMEELMRQEEAAAAAAARAAQEAEEERQRQAARKAAEEQAKRAQELAARELAEAQKKVGEWCKLHGYEDVNTQKKTMRGATKFPLHTAVKHKDDEMVGLLLKCGADQSKVSSKKQSPRRLAESMNSNGSHDAIIAMLR